ncbi:transmembrane 4 L6 family member 1 [Salminus brasiliensis]|uniref:transmembrane 4 L6 family member 1 n=1 Tax=Salminus brasiliensis TaxID=930266 RepID=UPI003B839624
MYSIRFSRCLGMAMIPMAVLSTMANLLLLFPSLTHRYLAESHITPEAVWCTGIWLSGFVVLVAARGFASRYTKDGCCLFRADMLCRVAYSCVAVCATGFCFLLNMKGLINGPLCLHNTTEGLEWGRPLKHQNIGGVNYLFEPERWASACDEPQGVVMWNIVLFSTIMSTSGLQALICTVQIIHAILATFFGPGFCKNQVVPA